MNEVKELLLDEIYNFDVNVIFREDKYAGRLTISNKSINLYFSFEENATFSYSDHFSLLVCEYRFNFKINLYNLSLKKASKKIIQRSSNDIVFNEYEFDVEYLFLDRVGYGLNSKQSFHRIRFFSNDINEWLGNTDKQFKLLNNFHGEGLCEFNCNINEKVYFSIDYSRTWYENKLSTGVNLIPYFDIVFSEEKDIKSIFKYIKEFKNLFDFIFGREIKFNQIFIYGIDNLQKTFFYKQSFELKTKHRYVFFPNMTNLRFPFLNYEFDFNIFSNYFNLSNHRRNLFYEFIKYKRFSNSEEKFLGFYRILEFLTVNKKKYFESIEDSFIERIKKILYKTNNKKVVNSYMQRCLKINDSKYNTHKCFSDFFNSLDDKVKEEIYFNIPELEKISKLRNDITHFNPYEITEEELLKYICVLEFLLINRLLRELNIDEKTILILSKRYDRLHSIRKKEEKI